MNLDFQIGSDIIRSYRRLAYTPWHALAEFIDNSTQSYFDHSADLDDTYSGEDEGLSVRIVYDRRASLLRITDNAMGMSLEELQRSMKLGDPPKNTGGRSQYGLGMKTAACWLGNAWSVTTKRLGDVDEHAIEVDVDAIAAGDLSLPYTSKTKDARLHYTVLEIRNLHHRFVGRTLGKIKDYLRSMYRVDIREGRLSLYWQDERLTWGDHVEFLKGDAGGEYRKTFNFDVNGKPVHGWAGILAEGGRARAGFAVLRRGRVLQAHPNEWRPDLIFGVGGRNDLINQRITGEIHFDAFEVSHTKDAIIWMDDDEEKVQKGLKGELVDYLAVARQWRKGSPDKRGPTDTEVDTAVDELRTEMESPEFIDQIEVDEVPPPEVVEASTRPIIEAAKKGSPRFRVQVGEAAWSVYLAADASPNDPYFASDVAGDDLAVVVNTSHPHWGQLEGSEGVLNYLRHCVYDAISEWKCRRMSGSLHSDTIKQIKDRLLRLPSQIEHAAYGQPQRNVVADENEADGGETGGLLDLC